VPLSDAGAGQKPSVSVEMGAEQLSRSPVAANRMLRSTRLAERMRRHRDRRQKGLRCVRIELRETEIDALIRRGRVAGDTRSDLAAVRKALYGFLDDYLR
jgi:hypothetical protein